MPLCHVDLISCVFSFRSRKLLVYRDRDYRMALTVALISTNTAERKIVKYRTMFSLTSRRPVVLTDTRPTVIFEGHSQNNTCTTGLSSLP